MSTDIKRMLLDAMDLLEHPNIISLFHEQQRLEIQALPDTKGVTR